MIFEHDGVVFADEATETQETDGPEPQWAPTSSSAEARLSELDRDQIEGPRRTVARAEFQNAQTEFFAACPACEGKNHVDALLCGRCGAEIPAAIPPSGADCPTRRHGVARERVAIDPELIPESIREQLREAEEEQAERIAARHVRYRWRRWSVTAGSGAFFGVLGGGIAAAFYLVVADATLSGRFAVAGVCALLAGLFAGHETFRRGGGRIEGTVVYGAAAFVFLGILIALGGHRVFQTGDSTLTSGLAGAMFIFPACFQLASSILGSIMGLSIELQNSDD